MLSSVEGRSGLQLCLDPGTVIRRDPYRMSDSLGLGQTLTGWQVAIAGVALQRNRGEGEKPYSLVLQRPRLVQIDY